MRGSIVVVGLVVVMVMVMVEQVGAEAVADPHCRHCHRHHHGVAAGLAFAGGYAAGHHSQHHHHGGGGGGCYNCGCGGCGGSCGWCGGSYGRRKRRSLDTFLQDAKTHETYSKIAAEDKDQCGLRLVCELAQKDPRDLVQDEFQVLLPYRGAGASDGTVYGDYDEAAWHGQEGHSCPDTYLLCAYTADKIMNAYRKYSKEGQDGTTTDQ